MKKKTKKLGGKKKSDGENWKPSRHPPPTELPSTRLDSSLETSRQTLDVLQLDGPSCVPQIMFFLGGPQTQKKVTKLFLCLVNVEVFSFLKKGKVQKVNDVDDFWLQDVHVYDFVSASMHDRCLCF